MPSLLLLLKVSWQSWLNNIRYASDDRRKKMAEVVGFVVLVTALYLIGRATFGVVKKQFGEAYGPTMLQAINTFMALGVFILIKDGMEGTIKRLYEAEDIPLLLSSPLPPATVFGFKLIQVIASNLFSMAVWLLPPWMAFGQLFGSPWHFYLALIPVCFCLLVVILSEMVLVMVVIVRFFSSRRMLQFLKALGMTIGVAAGFLLSASFLALEQSDQIAQFILTRLKAPVSGWYPHSWVANVMMGWVPGAETNAFRWAVQLAIASVGVPTLGVLLASRIYYQSWECARRVEAHAARAKKRQAKARFVLRGKMRSLMVKDFLIFIRHKGRMTLIVTLTLILLLVTLGAAYETRQGRLVRAEASLSLFGIGVQTMLYSVMATVGLTWGGYNTEKKTWRLLKSGPISPDLLFNSKFLVATLCAIVYTDAWFLLELALFRTPAWLWFPILSMAAVITATAIAFNTAIGALPWVAEIGQTDRPPVKRPALRIATMLFTFMMNLLVIVGPTLLLEIVVLKEVQAFGLPISRTQQMTIAGALGFLVSVWGGSYFLGRRSLRKLLNA